MFGQLFYGVVFTALLGCSSTKVVDLTSNTQDGESLIYFFYFAELKTCATKLLIIELPSLPILMRQIHV